MSIRVLILGFICAGLTGCGEYKQSVAYENGGYQGKTDQRHWDNASFDHEQKQWAAAVNARALRQNEYRRTGDGEQQP